MSLTLVVSGGNGRMGQQVQKLASDSNQFAQVYPVSRFKDFNKTGDVVIDFSLPEALDDLIKYCEKHKTPLVSGTTGLNSDQINELKKLSRSVPVLWSPNMSLGVMVVSKMIQELKTLSDWKIQISETHHIHKKDSPSGTAIRLKELVEAAVGHEIDPIDAKREGEVIGDHQILIQGPFEEISIEHRATDRRIFAQGAIRAAIWLVNQKPGFYSLQDLSH